MDISESGPEAFSKALLLDVQDIDANDKANPQLVSEYVNDIYEYMRMLEVIFPIVSDKSWTFYTNQVASWSTCVLIFDFHSTHIWH